MQTQLDRILVSPEFLAADQLGRFLRFVVQETLAGRVQSLKQYTIAVKALGRSASFDPQVDTIVRVQAGRLRRALQRYYHTLGADDPLIIEVPKGSYIPVFRPRAATGSPTPEADAEVMAPYYADLRADPHAASEPVQSRPFEPVMAVLPLADLSQEDRYAYMAWGLTEDIIIALTQYSALPIVGPLSRDRLKQEGVGPRGIGARYGARFVLDGSVRCHSGRIRVGVRLIDTATGTHVWAETYDRKLDEDALLEIEQEISLKVLGATADVHGVIHTTLSKELYSAPPANLSVHQAMLKFYHYLRTISAESYREARTALEGAVKSAPDYGPALAALGSLYVDEYSQSGAPKETVDQALAFVEKAFTLHADNYLVQCWRAFVYFYTHSVDAFMQAVELAVSTNPKSSNNGELASFCAAAGRPDRGLALFDQARQSNPHHPGYYYYAPFMAHAYQAEFEAALADARQIQMPATLLDPLARAVALGYLGRQPEGGDAVAELLVLAPDFKRRGRETVRRIFRYDQPVELMLEGLRKAGLELAE